MIKLTEQDLVIAALTIYGEARGESRIGRMAVFWTILQRAGNHRWWSKPTYSVMDACLNKYQYSCWNDNDPNCAVLLSFLTTKKEPKFNATALANSTVQDCVAIVKEVMSGGIADMTNGATHYYAKSLPAKLIPSWSKGKTPCFKEGSHIFFNDVESGLIRITPADLVPYEVPKTFTPSTPQAAPPAIVTPPPTIEPTSASPTVPAPHIVVPTTSLSIWQRILNFFKG